MKCYVNLKYYPMVRHFLLILEGKAACQSHRFQSWGQSYLLLPTGACQ